MSIKKHEATAQAINRLIKNGQLAAEEKEQLIEHMLGCPECLKYLDEAAYVLTGTSSGLGKWLEPGKACEECMEYLPQYAEEEETTARQRYPLVWKHLRMCRQCREEEAALRSFVSETENLGPLPEGNTEIVEPTTSSEPLIIRFVRRARLAWDKGKSLLEVVEGKAFSGVSRKCFTLLQSQALAPAYLSDDEIEVGELVYSLPSDLSLTVVIAPAGKNYVLTVTPKLGSEIKQGIGINIYRYCGDEDWMLIDVKEVKNRQSSVLPNLSEGLYSLRVETTVGGRETRWIVDLELR